MKMTSRMFAVSALGALTFGVGTSSAQAVDVVGEPTVTGTQVVTDGCQKTSVQVTATLTGVDDDGGGMDNVVFQLWDDGELKTSYTLKVPVGQKITRTVSMTFSGLYGLDADGVGVSIYDSENRDELFGIDPFIPKNVQGECVVTAPPTATVVPSTTTTSTTTTSSTSSTSTATPTTTTSPTSTATPTTTTSPTSTASPTTTSSSSSSVVTGPPVVTDGGQQPPADSNGALLLGAGLGVAVLAGLGRVVGRRLS